MGGMGWQTEDVGVSRLVERSFLRPQSTNGESNGWAGGGGGAKGEHVSVWDALVFGFFEHRYLVGGSDFGRAHVCLGGHCV